MATGAFLILVCSEFYKVAKKERDRGLQALSGFWHRVTAARTLVSFFFPSLILFPLDLNNNIGIPKQPSALFLVKKGVSKAEK